MSASIHAKEHRGSKMARRSSYFMKRMKPRSHSLDLTALQRSGIPLPSVQRDADSDAETEGVLPTGMPSGLPHRPDSFKYVGGDTNTRACTFNSLSWFQMKHGYQQQNSATCVYLLAQ